MPSQIEWTDETWNPVRGCAVVSAGCTNCYAMKQAHRFSGPGGPYEGLTQLSNGGPVWTGKIRLVPELLNRPLRWRRPRRIFVNSMSDLFHPDVPEEFIDRVFAAMAAGQRHTFQVLTKRPERMRGYLARLAPDGNLDRDRWDAARRPLWVTAGGLSSQLQEWIGVVLANPRWPLPNVALGVSVENQTTADERIPPLLQTPAALRFLSCEPLLGPLMLENYLCGLPEDEDGAPYPGRLHWLIAGGESGPGARPMHPGWIRQLRDQCVDADVPFFFKQWGAWAPVAKPSRKTLVMYPAGLFVGRHWRATEDVRKGRKGAVWVQRVGKKAAGRELDGEIWDQMPEIFRHSSGTVGDR